MFKSKAPAIITLIILIVIIIATAVIRAPWWFFIGEFFAYMALFSNLMALVIESRNPYAGRTLMKWAYAFAILFIVSLLTLCVVLIAFR